MTFVRPDGLAGALMAAEGFTDVTTVLHGPGGCRFRYMRLASELNPKKTDPPCPRDRNFFFGVPRIPSTFLDEFDYIYGGSERLDGVLKEVSVEDGYIAVVESPAAALIGDDVGSAVSRNGMEDRVLVLRKHLVSMPMNEGFDEMCREAVRFVSPEGSETERGSVNLIGLPILCKDWEGSIEELTRILDLMGLKVNMSIGSGCSIADLNESTSAEFNVAVFPEFCQGTASMFEQGYGIPTVGSGFAPIGFGPVREWIRAVAEQTGKDPSKALEYVDGTDRKARRILKSDARRASTTHGMHYSINAGASVAYPLVRWFYEYLSMIPDSIEVPFGLPGTADLLESFLSERSLEGSFTAAPVGGDLMVSSGDYAHMCHLSGDYASYLDVGFPPGRGFNFRNGTILGATGAMNILDSLYGR